MSDNQGLSDVGVRRWRTACLYLAQRWEVVFFLVVYLLLVFQVFFFVVDIKSLSYLHWAVAVFASFESFVVHGLAYVSLVAILLPVLYLLLCPGRPSWARKYLDVIGVYVVFRMAIQLIGLNLLVFDSVTPRFLLVTQLLFFLPYSLLIWGWVYWRLDRAASSGSRRLFRLDCEGEFPRPIDYLIASFSSVFSASISGVKGNSARARILILAHGFLIYDVMGLTLSRAVALVQGK